MMENREYTEKELNEMADELLADELLVGEAMDGADYTKDCEAADAKVTIAVKKA